MSQMMSVQILSHPTWDLILIFALLAIGFFYGVSRGRRRATSTLLTTYVTFAVFSVMPLQRIADLVGTQMIVIKLGVFIILFLTLLVLLAPRRMRVFRAYAWWQVLVLSILETGLLIHILFSFLAPETVRLLAPLTRTLFANPALHVWWFTIPLMIFIVVRRIGPAE